ncbi:MAG: hypothetical protein WKF89_18025, partial [Chitinophagaceae bacterium]
LSERGIRILFYSSLSIFAISTSILFLTGFKAVITLFLLLPGAMVLALYNNARRNFSDYLYYFVLDGLMMISALFTSIID